MNFCVNVWKNVKEEQGVLESRIIIRIIGITIIGPTLDPVIHPYHYLR